MRRLLAIVTISLIAAGTASAAAKGAARADYPTRYVPRSLDGQIVQVRNNVDGRTWSAWAYRNGAEYDLAVSVSTTPGVWSEPRLIGLDDGVDQGSPSFAVDDRGTVYLAYADTTGTVAVRALRAGGDTWSSPVGLTDARGAFSSPSLRVVGNALVVGVRFNRGVELIVLPLLPPPTDNVASIYDGPDPTGGREEGDDEDEDGQSHYNFTDHGQNSGLNPLPQQGMGDDD